MSVYPSISGVILRRRERREGPTATSATACLSPRLTQRAGASAGLRTECGSASSFLLLLRVRFALRLFIAPRPARASAYSFEEAGAKRKACSGQRLSANDAHRETLQIDLAPVSLRTDRVFI